MAVIKKRALVITYYWPPAGGPGVQRVLKFVKYLSHNGWEPIVLTVRDGEYPALDHTLRYEIPGDLIIYKTKTIEPFNLYKRLLNRSKKANIETYVLENKKRTIGDHLASWVRNNLFLPDGRIGWKRYAVSQAIKIIEKHNIDVLFTTSPPHTVQVIGAQVKKKTGVKWVADYRDPWVDAFWEASVKRVSWAQKKLEKQERRAISNADRIVTATEGFKKLFLSKYPSLKIKVITNGYEESDFESDLNRSKNEIFTICYTGSIAPSQNPHKLIDAIALLKNKGLTVRLDIYGSVNDELKNTIVKKDLVDVVVNHGYVSHDVIIKKMQGADLLLLLIPEGRGDIMPGKLFEYIGSRRRILCMGPKGEASDIVTNLGVGKHAEFDESVLDELEYFVNNKDTTLIDVKNELLERYTRKYQATQLANVLDDVLV